MLKISKKSIKKSNIRCYHYRNRILQLSQKVGALHIGGSFSSVEILDVIYNFLKKKMTSSSFQKVIVVFCNMLFLRVKK